MTGRRGGRQRHRACGLPVVSRVLVFCAQSPDGKYLASGAIDGIINIFDIATGKLLHTLEGTAARLPQAALRPQRGAGAR